MVNIINSGVMEKGGQWKERDMAIVILGLRTGMRISEIVGLNISDIDFGKREIIIVGKGNKKRKIYLTGKMIDDLKSWIELRKEILYNINQNCNALFISSHCTRLSDAAARNMIERYTEVIGHKISPHK